MSHRALAKTLAFSAVVLTSVASFTAVWATSAAAAPEAANTLPTVEFLSPDQYAAKFGKAAPATATASPIHGLVRTNAGQIIDTDAFDPAAASRVTSPKTSLDPSPGSTIYTIMWTYTDLKNRTSPTRLGNSDFGYNHYVAPHNLYTQAPFRVIPHTKNAYVESGAKVEYRALLTDLSDGDIVITVRISTHMATRTDDGKYTSPDGKYIGTITAYCEGVTKCPSWVNALS